MNRQPATTYSDDLLTPAEVHATYGFAEQTLANWRWQRRGPEFVKSSPGKGGRVKYRRSAVETWLSQHTVSTSPG